MITMINLINSVTIQYQHIITDDTPYAVHYIPMTSFITRSLYLLSHSPIALNSLTPPPFCQTSICFCTYEYVSVSILCLFICFVF